MGPRRKQPVMPSNRQCAGFMTAPATGKGSSEERSPVESALHGRILRNSTTQTHGLGDQLPSPLLSSQRPR